MKIELTILNDSEKPNSSKFYTVTPQVDNVILVKPFKFNNFTELEKTYVYNALSNFLMSKDNDHCIVHGVSVYDVISALENYQPYRTSQGHIDNEKRNIENLEKTIANPAWQEGYIANCKSDLESRQRDLEFLETYCAPLAQGEQPNFHDQCNYIKKFAGWYNGATEYHMLSDLRQLLDENKHAWLNDKLFTIMNNGTFTDTTPPKYNLLTCLVDYPHQWTTDIIQALYDVVRAYKGEI